MIRVPEVIRGWLGLCPDRHVVRNRNLVHLREMYSSIHTVDTGYVNNDLHVGEKSGKELLFGNVVTWRPLTRAACVLVIPFIFFTSYTFSRREIFDAHN